MYTKSTKPLKGTLNTWTLYERGDNIFCCLISSGTTTTSDTIILRLRYIQLQISTLANCWTCKNGMKRLMLKKDRHFKHKSTLAVPWKISAIYGITCQCNSNKPYLTELCISYPNPCTIPVSYSYPQPVTRCLLPEY